MFNGKNVLVDGGAGFVGVNVIRRLFRESAHVRATIQTKAPALTDARVDIEFDNAHVPESVEEKFFGHQKNNKLMDRGTSESYERTRH